jgi:hypothetical protein
MRSHVTTRKDRRRGSSACGCRWSRYCVGFKRHPVTTCRCYFSASAVFLVYIGHLPPDRGGRNARMRSSVTIMPLFPPVPKPCQPATALHVDQTFTLLIGRYISRQLSLVLTLTPTVLPSVQARCPWSLRRCRVRHHYHPCHRLLLAGTKGANHLSLRKLSFVKA